MRLGLMLEQSQHVLILNLMFGRPLVRIHRVFVVGESRSVGEQVAHGDGACVGRKAREDIGKRLVVAELAVVYQEHDGHRGELLGERRQAEIRDGIDLSQAAQIPHAVAALEDRAAVLADEDGESRGLRAGERSEDRIQLRVYRLLGAGGANQQERRHGADGRW